MAASDQRIVVIVGADHPTGLGLARALYGRNCQIVGLYRNDTPCCKSKTWDQLIRIDSYEDIVEHLLHAGKARGGKAALFVASDSAVKLVSDNRDVLLSYYHFLLPVKEVVDCFLDKTKFYEWALENGFKVPVSAVCSTQAELDICLSSIPFPVIIKPFEKTDQWERISPIHKTFQLLEKEDLNKIPFDLFSAADKILVQQWIAGGDRNVYFSLVYYSRQGKKIADYTGRKLFQWPILCGSTAAAIGEVNEEVSRITEELFNRVGYCGLGSVEFKRSDADGEFYIVEPTVGRNDLQSGLAVAGGVNLPGFALAEVFGDANPKLRRRASVWIHEEGLLDSIYTWRKRRLLKIKDLLKLMRLGISFAHFSIFDLGPGLVLLKKKLYKKALQGKKLPSIVYKR